MLLSTFFGQILQVPWIRGRIRSQGLEFVFLVAISSVILFSTTEGKEALKIMLDSRTEIRRVVWPTRTETTQTTLIVIVAVTISGLLLWGLDSLFGWATASILG